MKTSVSGYPRIGTLRELKFAAEDYFSGKLSVQELEAISAALRKKHWETQKEAGIALIPSNDFSLYDGMLDTAVLLNAVPERYRALKLDATAEYFAMARGYQGENGDVRALAMKKWFNTNYHYMVPEIGKDTDIRLAGSKPLDEFLEAKLTGIQTKPVLIGPYTFLKLAVYSDGKKAEDYASTAAAAYSGLIGQLANAGAEWIQLDEPALVLDMDSADKALFAALYQNILSKKAAKILLQTYFGDVRDVYAEIISMNFDGIGLDFAEGIKSLEWVRKLEFPQDKVLVAGVVNGKNIWRNSYAQTMELLTELRKYAGEVILGTSCSLLHVPYTLENENKLAAEYKKHFAFAQEKLTELSQLGALADIKDYKAHAFYQENTVCFTGERGGSDPQVKARMEALTDEAFVRLPVFGERQKIQRERFKLPLLPTTTIGSFPQTADVRENRARFRKGEITSDGYKACNKEKIRQCVALQEELGLDVLVHGEFERNDMVEHFGENLSGFLFTEKAWVQSYGTRCVKPPILWGDVSRMRPVTVEYAVFAQSLTKKPVKGMLTGPVTILNWSFPREDITLRESALQIALAIRDEVLDLERSGISIIQVDEAALKEKLPLRRQDWQTEYLEWAIPAFRLVHSGVRPETQIHTHMCYSEFSAIVREIDAMDADVISFEASRSKLEILDALEAAGFKTQVGPGVYDIHSPRVPSVEEITEALHRMLRKIPKEKLWVNPDCGLKTRGEEETIASLRNLAEAARRVRM